MSDDEIGIWINGPDQQEDAVRPAITYQIGDHVRITDGPLESSTGVVSAVDPEQGKLKLTVPIFGRYNTIEVELWQVERDEE
jgi:transcriptional antiterminator NusG